MIHIDSLTKSYNDNSLFTNVHLSIKAGMRMGLVGANGAGKTTLLKILLGEEDYDSGNIQKNRGISIGYLPQEIISGTESTVLEESLKSFSELKKIEEEISSLHQIIKKDPDNKFAIKTVGDLQH